ncbi:uncharacterized protein LOC124474143 isoform X2 [Hypomesus transpacificus]|uniref:uncharacterized protein LOC124474143 isoform X2 n=1 Tax=Hypomesus transpacificus TaxID=137520 RepID=UPI001F088041|nr:uncharacterized protein LOC124474143 isoform X2 [Hypomesus transpacificus]
MASIRVAVRVRPLNKREKDMSAKVIVRMEGCSTSILNPKHISKGVPADEIKDEGKTFSFDFSYDSTDIKGASFVPQEQVFQDLGSEVLTAAFEGYNACVFAYGQTGSGKSYTMMGNPGDVGLIPRICEGLFCQGAANSQTDGTSFLMEVSYIEIYNERVQDLLQKTTMVKGSLRVREHPKDGPYVQGLSQHQVHHYSEVEDLMASGNARRTTACTAMNDVSSRSHAIFTIHFTQARFDPALPSETVSKVHLVDLAGSERADATRSSGARLKEGANINRSLVTLGSVISALADLSDSGHGPQASRKRKLVFVPYRDSVLTWLLKDSLGGNSKTIMIAALSPADVNYGETLSTLRYANRAKNIVNSPMVNEDPSVRVIRELQAEIARLRDMVGPANQDLSGDPASTLRVEKKLHRNEAKVLELTKEWASKWGETQNILKEETLALRKEGSGVVLDSALPHLIGIDEDLLSTGIILYHLKEGRTLVGQDEASSNQDIVLHGPGLQSDHCVFENCAGTVTLVPSPGAWCSVNGVEIHQPCHLTQGAVVQLGRASLFRFNHPSEAAQLREQRKSGLLSCSRLCVSVPDLSRASESLAKAMLLYPGLEFEKRQQEKLKKLENRRKQEAEPQTEGVGPVYEEVEPGIEEVGPGSKEVDRQSEGVEPEPKGAEPGVGQQGEEEPSEGCLDTCDEERRGEEAEGEGGEAGGKEASREAGGKEASRVVGHDDPGTKERREDRRKLQSARPGVHARNIRTASVWMDSPSAVNRSRLPRLTVPYVSPGSCPITNEVILRTRLVFPPRSAPSRGDVRQRGVSTRDALELERDSSHESGPEMVADGRAGGEAGAGSGDEDEDSPGEGCLRQEPVPGRGDGCVAGPEGHANERQGVLADGSEGSPGSEGSSLDDSTLLRGAAGTAHITGLPHADALLSADPQQTRQAGPGSSEEAALEGRFSLAVMDGSRPVVEGQGGCETQSQAEEVLDREQASGLGSLVSRVSWVFQDAGRFLRGCPARSSWSSQVVSLLLDSQAMSVVKDSQVFSLVKESQVFSLVRDSMVFSLVKELPLELNQDLQPVESVLGLQSPPALCLPPAQTPGLSLPPAPPGQTPAEATDPPQHPSTAGEGQQKATLQELDPSQDQDSDRAPEESHKQPECKQCEGTEIEEPQGTYGTKDQDSPSLEEENTGLTPVVAQEGSVVAQEGSVVAQEGSVVTQEGSVLVQQGSVLAQESEGVPVFYQSLVDFSANLLQLRSLPLPSLVTHLQSALPASLLSSQKILALYWLSAATCSQPLPQPALLILLESALYTLTSDHAPLALFHQLPLLQLREVQVGFAGQSVRLLGLTEDSLLSLHTLSPRLTQELCRTLLGAVRPGDVQALRHPLLQGDLPGLSLAWGAHVPDLLLDAGLRVCCQFQKSLADLVYLLHGNMDEGRPSLGEVCLLLYTSVGVCVSPQPRAQPRAQLLLTDTHLALLQEDGVFHPPPRSLRLAPLRPQFQDLTLRRRSQIRCVLVRDGGNGPQGRARRLDVIWARPGVRGHTETEASASSGRASNSSLQAEVWKLTLGCSAEAACLINHLSDV